MKPRVFILVLLVLFLACACTGGGQKANDPLMINDFESDLDLDRLTWKCRTLFELSEDHAFQGRTGLKVRMFPAPYPGVSFRGVLRNWSDYDVFAMDVFNPEEQGTLSMTLRIDDKEETPEFRDRVNHPVTLVPGRNRIHLILSELLTPSGRSLNWDNICTLIFFTANPSEQKVLYLDAVRVETLEN